jgi:hypothetical protein
LQTCEAKAEAWFNGKERIVLKKIETSQEISFKEMNDFLLYGAWEETRLRYEELKPRENLKSIFHQVKRTLQKTVVGSTNEPDIAKNVLKILFCKIFDEKYQNEKNNWPATLYVENQSQFHGWFNSSLIASVIMSDKDPYRRVLSHGFVVDKKLWFG